MKSFYLLAALIALALLPARTATASGTAKAKRVIYLRRELVALRDARPRFEYHADSGRLHALVCRAAAPVGCWWTTPPAWPHSQQSLAYIDWAIMQAIGYNARKSRPGNEGYLSVGKADVHWRRLPTGFEYVIEEGPQPRVNMDDIARRVNAAAGR